jgi:hypothetical protein
MVSERVLGHGAIDPEKSTGKAVTGTENAGNQSENND